VLGAGGMGQVFEAQDHSLDRRVAIKANWPNLPAPPLRNEARALAAFRHPSLVTVHGIGVHRGIDYIVMERVYGVSLADLLRQRHALRQRVSVEEALKIFLSIAEGLSVVHGAGIAHRDIKPGNVMLTPDHRVVLMDFGLFLPEFDMAEQKYIAGSPPYMAPEALANVLEAGSGPMMDIYSLGVTAYELLTMRLPRDAEGLDDLWKLHQQPVRDIRELRDDVPDELAELILEMLHRDPGHRPQGAEELAWQLRAIAEGGKPSSPSRRAIRLLVVEDDPDVARILAFYAKKSLGTVETRTASNGLEALEMLRESPPDVMFLDLHMPKMNGLEVGMYMRGEGLAPDCHIVAVSAGAQPDDHQLLKQLGVRHFVLKGPDMGNRIAAVLERIVHTGVTQRVVREE